MGKFDWGVWYVIIFQYVQFWIRLAAVSKRDKKVPTVAFPVVRSVNKSRDTRHCVQNKPEYATCAIFTTRSYYKALGLILCVNWYSKYAIISIVLTMSAVMLQVTERCQYWTRPVPWWQPMNIPLWCHRLRDQNCYAFCKTYWKWKRVMDFTLWCFL